MTNKSLLDKDKKQSRNENSNSETTIIRRKKRIPVFKQERLGSYPSDDGYFYRWANGYDDITTKERIASLLKAGYELVDKNQKGLGDMIPNFQDPSWNGSLKTQPVGGGVTSYLMRIPLEIYQEDQKDKMIENHIDLGEKTKPRLDGEPKDKVYGEITYS